MKGSETIFFPDADTAAQPEQVSDLRLGNARFGSENDLQISRFEGGYKKATAATRQVERSASPNLQQAYVPPKDAHDKRAARRCPYGF